MRYAIAYVSRKRESVTEMEVRSILENTCKFNNENDVTGLLIYSEGFFFQLIEGEKDLVKEIYNNKILKDSHHKDIISFVATEISKPAYDGFYCDNKASRWELHASKLKIYLDHIKVLESHDRNAVIEVLNKFFPGSDLENLKDNSH